LEILYSKQTTNWIMQKGKKTSGVFKPADVFGLGETLHKWEQEKTKGDVGKRVRVIWRVNESKWRERGKDRWSYQTSHQLPLHGAEAGGGDRAVFLRGEVV
jgi:hypothetical protein